MEKNVVQIKIGMAINVNSSVKNIIYLKKDYIWNPATNILKNVKYLVRSIDDDSVIMCDKIMEENKTIRTKFKERKQPVKLYFLKFLYFTYIIDRWYYLLSSDKI